MMDSNEKLILFLDEVKENYLPLVGGKGLNLGTMNNSNFPVPTGFCDTTLSYKEFIEHNNLDGFLVKTLQRDVKRTLGKWQEKLGVG